MVGKDEELLLMSTEFQFYRMKEFCEGMGVNRLKTVRMVTFVMCILPLL